MFEVLLPFTLALFSLLNLFFIRRGRQAVIGGNWQGHRNLMVLSLALSAATIGGFALLLWSTRLWALIGTKMLFLTYVTLVLVSGLMLIVTLWRVARHLLLPHKLLARKTVLVWQMACLSGAVLYFLIGFSSLA